jgi:hypothetical protein
VTYRDYVSYVVITLKQCLELALVATARTGRLLRLLPTHIPPVVATPETEYDIIAAGRCDKRFKTCVNSLHVRNTDGSNRYYCVKLRTVCIHGWL